MTPYDCESHQQNQKCYTRNQGKLHWRAIYLIHPCHLYRVFFETVVTNGVATPAAFRLARMQNHNKTISASWDKGVKKMIESNYSIAFTLVLPSYFQSSSCCWISRLSPVPQYLMLQQEKTDKFPSPLCLPLAMGLYSVASRDPTPFRVPQHVQVLQISCLLCLFCPNLPAYSFSRMHNAHSQLSLLGFL